MEALIEQARARDDGEFQEALQRYSSEITESEKLRRLARRILDGEPKAYTEALTECSAFGEISEREMLCSARLMIRGAVTPVGTGELSFKT